MSLVPVVVRPAVIGIPGIVRIIIGRVVSVIFRFGRMTPVIDVVNVGTAA